MDNTPTPAANAGEMRSFSHFLAEHEDGELNNELTETLRQIIGELSNYALDHGGKPKAILGVVFQISLDNGVLEVTGTIKKQMPQPPRGRAVYWATPNNGLTRRNPRQGELPFLRDVTGQNGTAIKSV
ncbi:MAG: hypothetical protein IPI58_09740 [Alphaproteobacteria bacterium]|nr:MAG: hypothetical protein IPI58_09740 [Alphaproteobacteria bacterium]